MGSIRELSARDKNVHLLISNSNLAEIYVYDTLKSTCGANVDSIYRVDRVSQFREVIELAGMQSYLADNWLFVINYSKVKAFFTSHIGILDAETAYFLILVNTYADYKEFKQLCPRANDMYLSFLRESDVGYLFKGYQLPQKIISFISRSYGRDPEKIFELLNQVKNGYEVSSQKDVVRVCGASAGSVVHFAMSLLKEKSVSKKGERTVLRNRIREASELADVYGIRSFRGYLLGSVRDILDIKTLYMEGTIYRSVRDLPECYDEKKLSRYNYYFRIIVEEIPYSRILELYLELRRCGTWNSRLEMLRFIYNYYGGCVDGAVS